MTSAETIPTNYEDKAYRDQEVTVIGSIVLYMYT